MLICPKRLSVRKMLDSTLIRRTYISSVRMFSTDRIDAINLFGRPLVYIQDSLKRIKGIDPIDQSDTLELFAGLMED